MKFVLLLSYIFNACWIVVGTLLLNVMFIMIEGFEKWKQFYMTSKMELYSSVDLCLKILPSQIKRETLNDNVSLENVFRFSGCARTIR